MIVSITHEHDLDGLGSQAIIKRYFEKLSIKQQVQYLDATYSNFIELMKKQFKLEDYPSKLIISDIGFNNSFKVLFNVFKSAKTNDCHILWFDHHIVDASVRNNITELVDVYVNDTKKCATEIVQEYFLPDDSVAMKIAEFARDTDFKTGKFKLASDIQLIIGYNIGTKGFKNRRKVVDLLSEGKFTDPWFEIQIKELDKWRKEQSQLAIQNKESINVEDFGKVSISFAKIGGGKINQILKKEDPSFMVYIGIDLRYNEIIIHSDFVKCRDFARHFGGGGHKDRAGFKHSHIFTAKKQLSDKFIQDISKALLKYKK
jgi:nanoRNase/pAp phosphatase (c-di-AMP/oligoRNAs hydrolase)